MTVITDLLEQHQPLMEQLHLDDLAVVEEALLNYLPEDVAKGAVRGAVTELATDCEVDADALWEALVTYWSLSEEEDYGFGNEDELDEAFGRKMKAFGRKAKRGYRKAKRGYNRAKNSRTGRAARRVAKAARKGYGRVRNSKHGADIVGAAASIIGL